MGTDNTMSNDHHPCPDDIDRELEEMLSEAEETVTRLRDALQARREHGAQHAEIDRLEEHMANARVSWREVRNFLDIVWREITGSANTSKGDARGV
ncbi:hypothetical protein [Mycobacterium sp. SMC-4]|uniref:hypothetical protein n=1 Tax=Mycobacterium sp. SMC-4 TaxID=2857059 RepID=UPI0021B4B2F2|nr:hypothetical protein [Mycobacterium sp. SMC-4]UXA18563.1 hypothetical protein KXD98_02285 [Mycobacterium sp. SMC-4]